MNKQKHESVRHAWESKLSAQLRLLGHRNWVVIADAAYPYHSAAGIETIVVEGEPLQVIRKAIALVESCSHLDATIYTDRELQFVEEKDAPGVTRLRQEIAELLNGRQARKLPHQEIIARLDACARTFQVLARISHKR